MEKTVYEAFHTDEGITEELLQEAARLFSENYGVWDKQAPHKVGKFAKEGRSAWYPCQLLCQQK